MRRLRIAASVTEMAALRPLWEHLEGTTGATCFQSFRWNLAAARHLGQRERPYVVAVESDSGAAIVPAALCGRGLTFLGELLFDYRDALVAGDAALLDEALAELATTGRELWLPAVREGAHIAACGQAEPWVGAPVVRRETATAASFLQQHFKGRRQLHRLQSAGATFGRYHGDAQELLRWTYQRKAEQYAGSKLDIFSDPARRACMLEIASASGTLCEVFTIEAGSTTVAVLVTFRDPGVRRLYTMWYDRAWARFSPGTTLMLHAIHSSLGDGLDVDLLTGEGPHKVRFANGRVQLYRLRASAEDLRAGGKTVSIAA